MLSAYTNEHGVYYIALNYIIQFELGNYVLYFNIARVDIPGLQSSNESIITIIMFVLGEYLTLVYYLRILFKMLLHSYTDYTNRTQTIMAHRPPS